MQEWTGHVEHYARLVLAEDEEFANDKTEVTRSWPQPVKVVQASITRVASSSVKRRPPLERRFPKKLFLAS